MLQTKNEQRIAWIDVLKGLTIFMVVWGHLLEHYIPNQIYALIYSFHMPCFMIASGYVFNPYKYNQFKKIFIAKWKGFIKPIYFYGSVVLIFNLIFKLCKGEINSFCQQKFTIKNLLGTAVLWRAHSLCSFWFLTALFVAQLILYIQIKYLKRDYFILLLSMMSFIIGYVTLHRFKIALPYDMELGLMANLFVVSGFFLKKYGIVMKLIKKNYLLTTGMVTFILYVGVVYMNYTYFGRRAPSFIFADFMNPFLYIVGTYAGTITTVVISAKLQRVKILKMIGMVSMTIYCLHGIINTLIFANINKVREGIRGELLMLGIAIISTGILAYIGWLIKRRHLF